MAVKKISVGSKVEEKKRNLLSGNKTAAKSAISGAGSKANASGATKTSKLKGLTKMETISDKELRQRQRASRKRNK